LKIRTLAGLFVATVLAGGISTGVAGAAHATPATTPNAAPTTGVATNAEPNPGGFYEIATWYANPTGSKCVDVPSRSTNRFTLLQVFHCQSTDNQRWTFDGDVRNGFAKIVNLRSGQCIDLQNTSGANGTPIEQDICQAFDAQQWHMQVFFDTATSPSFALTNRLFPNKCLTRAGGFVAVDHDKLVIQDCNPNLGSQTWGLG
jgi:hypothetical protein